jgi:hypothetical protein
MRFLLLGVSVHELRANGTRNCKGSSGTARPNDYVKAGAEGSGVEPDRVGRESARD